MKKKLIILNTSQFGLLTDSYKWCQYLRHRYDITFICFDNKKKRQDLDGVTYKYLYRPSNSFLRGCWYILFSLLYCFFNPVPVFIVYFDYCHLFPLLLGRRRFHVDVRTLSVTPDETVNQILDKKLRNSLSHFRSLSFISEGVKDKVALSIKNQYILPLGSDIISSVKKNFDTINLLYVGTLNHRDIHKTIEGLNMYTQKYGKGNITYDIIGDGAELKEIITIVESFNLSDIVAIHGHKPYDELVPFFDRCNVGVSFIPIKECYQNQPPTKSYEYILSGLFCVATRTIANEQIICKKNGVLINDSPQSFFDGLCYIKDNHNIIDSNLIRDTLVKKYRWESVIKNSLEPIIINLVSDQSNS